MISRQLIDLINSGEAIAIVGSGVSVDAGVASWPDLTDAIASQLEGEGHDTKAARKAASAGHFPEAMDVLVSLTSRDDIHARVSAVVERVGVPGAHHKRLADFPFRLLVTLNYDHLLESAATVPLTPVGNRGRELYKISADTRDVVWHIHGGSRLPADLSQIVVSRADYDDFYPRSNPVSKLHALTTAFRCVFVGFGFRDQDFLRVLETVGRLSHRGRPSYAFLGFEDPSGSRNVQTSIREKYNVEVIPYRLEGASHHSLHRLLDAYVPFIVPRSVDHTHGAGSHLGYEPRAAGLKVQGALDLAELASANEGLRDTLLGARVLACVREHPGCTVPRLLASVFG